MATFGTGRSATSAAAITLGVLLAAIATHAEAKGLQINMITEIAGGDGTDVATPEQLKQADTPMIPAHPETTPPPTSFPPETKRAASKPAPATEKKAPAAAAKAQQKKAAPAMAPAAKSTTSMKPKTAAAPSTTGFYLRAEAGYSWAQNPDGHTAAGALSGIDVGGTGVVRGGIGYRVSRAFRLELTGGYRPNRDVDATDTAGRTTKTKVDAATAMLAAYVDVTPIGDRLGGGWMPYLGAGLGWARLDTATRTVSGGQPSEGKAASDNVTYALMAGMAAPLADRLTLDIGYRFQDLGGFRNSGSFSDGSSQSATHWDHLLVHELTLGVRYAF